MAIHSPEEIENMKSKILEELKSDFSDELIEKLHHQPNTIPTPTHTFLSYKENVAPIEMENISLHPVVISYIQTSKRLVVEYQALDKLEHDIIMATVYFGKFGRMKYVGRFVWRNEDDEYCISIFNESANRAYTSTDFSEFFTIARRLLTTMFPPPEGKKWIPTHQIGKLVIPGRYE